MTHNLGAVQWGAPHSTQPLGGNSPQYGHCWQGADVMCYVEDAGASHPMQQDCAGLPGAIPQNYDCGRDDYFNPAPAAGSYLATHWNTYDSAFLAPCGEIAPACGGGKLWVPEPPAATTAPSVAGIARRGSTLTARTGAWTNAPTGYTYQWQRLVAAGWEDIDGADPADVRRRQRGPRTPPARHGRRHQRGRQRQRRLRRRPPDRRLGRQPRGERHQGKKESKKARKASRAPRRRRPRSRRPPPRRGEAKKKAAAHRR